MSLANATYFSNAGPVIVEGEDLFRRVGSSRVDTGNTLLVFIYIVSQMDLSWRQLAKSSMYLRHSP